MTSAELWLIETVNACSSLKEAADLLKVPAARLAVRLSRLRARGAAIKTFRRGRAPTPCDVEFVERWNTAPGPVSAAERRTARALRRRGIALRDRRTIFRDSSAEKAILNV